MGVFESPTVPHLILLSTILFGASLYVLITLTHRMRLRRVLMTFRPHWITVNSAGAGLFLLLALGASAWSLTGEGPISPIVGLGYVMAGGFWLAAALIDQLVVITEHGIVKNLRRPERAVAWGQILDYFVRDVRGRRVYVFLHARDELRAERLDIRVPARYERCFREVVDEKLDARYEYGLETVPGSST